jgi:hypothetical protein
VDSALLKQSPESMTGSRSFGSDGHGSIFTARDRLDYCDHVAGPEALQAATQTRQTVTTMPTATHQGTQRSVNMTRSCRGPPGPSVSDPR